MNQHTLTISADVHNALREDVGGGDVTAALLPAQLIAAADIITREPMLVCGQAWVNEVFYQIDKSIEIEWLVKEGQWLDAPKHYVQSVV